MVNCPTGSIERKDQYGAYCEEAAQVATNYDSSNLESKNPYVLTKSGRPTTETYFGNTGISTNPNSVETKNYIQPKVEKLPNLPKITKPNVKIRTFDNSKDINDPNKHIGNGFIYNGKIYTSKHILSYTENYNNNKVGLIKAGDGSIKINEKMYPIANIYNVPGIDLSIITLKGDYIETNTRISNNFHSSSGFTVYSDFGTRNLGNLLGTVNYYLQDTIEGNYKLYALEQGQNPVVEGDSGSMVVNNDTGEVVGIVAACDLKNGLNRAYIQPLYQ